MREGVAVKVEISTLVMVVIVICFFVYIILLCAMLRHGTRRTRAAGTKVGAEPVHQHENQSNAFNGDTLRAYEVGLKRPCYANQVASCNYATVVSVLFMVKANSFPLCLPLALLFGKLLELCV